MTGKSQVCRFRIGCALVLASTVVPSFAFAQTTTPMTERDLIQRVQVLAHDSMLGREAGHIGNVRATSYVARELRRLGLAEAGEESSYFQDVPLVTRGPVPDARLLVAGIAVPEDAVTSMRPMAGTPFGGVFDGTDVASIYGGLIGGTLVDPALVRGKVVVFHALRDARNAVTGSFAGPPGLLAPYASAAAILLVGLDEMPPQVAGGLRVARFTLGDPAAPRMVPAAVVSHAVAGAIFGTSLENGPGTAGAAISGRFGLRDTPTPQRARNVIGIVRGTDPVLRNEYVAIGAHTDHVGVGTPVDHDSVRLTNEVIRPQGANSPTRAARTNEAEIIRQMRAEAATRRAPRRDSIFNGADDNASGTAVALEMAEYFMKNPPKRSLLFVFHTAEEKGLFGAQYFTDHPTVPRDAIVTQVNLDQVSRGGPADLAGSEPNTVFLLGTRRLSTQLGDLVERVNAQAGHNLRLDYSLDEPGHPASGYCRSDHYMYARYSIPIVFMSAGWHRDYHMVTDEAQYVNPRTMLQIGRLVSDVVKEVANLRERPLVDRPRLDPATPCRQ